MKMQSLGNLIAVTSYKPNVATGQVEDDVGALGRIAVGEIMETMIIRIYEFRDGRIGPEIAGITDASAWQPWEVTFANAQLTIRRSTNWQDQHVQQWQITEGPEAVVIWVEFATREPGEWRCRGLTRRAAEWVSDGGEIVAMTTDGHIGAMVSGPDADAVREQLQRGQSSTTPIGWRDHWYRGVVAWVRKGPPQGIFALSVDRSAIESQRKLAAILANPQAVAAEARRGWEAFYAHDIPACPGTTQQERAIWQDAWFVLRANRMDYAHPPLVKPFGSPSKFNYRHQWLWDSGFHAIVWRWANDKHRAQEETANLFDNPCEHGRICHEIYRSSGRREHDWPTGQGCFAPTSQPPVLAMAAEKVFAQYPDRVWLKGIYPRLRPYLDWWSTVRDPDGDGLAGWANGFESGLDDSPRWDHITRAGNAYYPAPVEAVELNALLVNEWRAVAQLARQLGRKADVRHAEASAARIKAAMCAKLWNERDGFFYCLDHEEKSIPIKTVGGLLGLLALEPGDREIAPLLKHLTDPQEFWTPYPVPSVAVCEKTFSRGQMWRGPTWINTNWLLIRALERLEQTAVARELKERTLAMVVAEGSPKIWEWYDPISGKALGNMEYGWSTLVIDLMMQ